MADNLDELLADGNLSDDYLYILYCRRGSMQVELDSHNLLVQPGDLALCFPNTLHGHYMRTPDFESKISCVSVSFLNAISLECFRGEPLWLEKMQYIRTNPLLHLNAFQKDLLTSYHSLMQVYMRGVQDAYRQEIIHSVARATVLEIMSYLDVVVDHPMAEEEPSAVTQKDLILRRFLQLLRGQELHEREVNWYAEQLNITPKYLSAICKERSGKTAMQWITEYTISEVKRLLLHSDLAVKEVAVQLGFADMSFFSQYVRKHLGKTPTQLRAEQL